MARKRQLKSAARMSASQINRAENFRYLLLNYAPYTGQEKTDWQKIVNNLSALELTNLSRQYKTVLETWYDSSAVVSMLSQDVIKRIQHLGRVDMAHARQALFGASAVPATSNRRLSQMIQASDAAKAARAAGKSKLTRQEKSMILRDIKDTEILAKTGYAPVTRHSKARGHRKSNRRKWTL